MDVSETTAPKSDQQNAEDYIGGPRTVTVESVSKGSTEQPVEIHLVEFPGRPFKPSKTVRRILVAAWGKDSTPWAGRRMTLYCDPTIKFGGQEVGGIRVSHLSGIDRRLTLNLTVAKGKRAPHVIDPLPDMTTEPTADDVAGCTDRDALRAMFRASVTAERKDQIKARVAELDTPKETA